MRHYSVQRQCSARWNSVDSPVQQTETQYYQQQYHCSRGHQQYGDDHGVIIDELNLFLVLTPYSDRLSTFKTRTSAVVAKP